MNYRTKLSPVIFGCAVLASSLAPAAELVTFGGGSVAYDISADGKTVAGSLGSQSFIWSAASGIFTPTGDVAPGNSGTGGSVRISDDGGTLLSNRLNNVTGRYEPATYSVATNSWTLLGSNGGAGTGSTSGSAYAMTADGRYVAGASYTGTAASSYHATVWDTTTGTHTDISGGAQSRVQSISNDGAVAVGYTSSNQTSAIWRRQADGSYTKSAIIRPDGSTSLSITTAVSSNGLWATGASFSTATDQPYYYNVTTGVATYFPKLSLVSGNGRSVATPSAISMDGKTIIGTHGVLGTLDTNTGFIWNANLGVMNIDDYFASNGIDTADAYTFVSPLSMTFLDDGTMSIVGIAKDNSTNVMTGFLVNVAAPVPEPADSAMLVVGLGLLGAAIRRNAKRTV